jgi:hypothetical protein
MKTQGISTIQTPDNKGDISKGTSWIQNSLSNTLQQNDNNTIAGSFKTLSTEEEILYLKKWLIPPETIYTWEAGRLLHAIDNQINHPYSLLINNGIAEMILRHLPNTDSDAPRLQKCLWETETWVDIGTWNGIVSNMVAHPLYLSIGQARLNKRASIWAGEQRDSDLWNPTFISCDLSEASLNLAETLARDSFHDLTKFFTLEYYPGKFQTLLESQRLSKKPRLITMFNVLANYKYNDLKTTLIQMFGVMHEGDIFIPTFFHIENHYDKNFPYNTYGAWWFHDLSRALYDNPETQNRCVSAFCDRYKVGSSKTIFSVTWNNDGRSFIDVNILVPNDTHLYVPQEGWHSILLNASSCWEQSNIVQKHTKFNAFPSYRMTKQQIIDLCTAAWFKIEYRMTCPNGLQIAPVLYR